MPEANTIILAQSGPEAAGAGGAIPAELCRSIIWKAAVNEGEYSLPEPLPKKEAEPVACVAARQHVKYGVKPLCRQSRWAEFTAKAAALPSAGQTGLKLQLAQSATGLTGRVQRVGEHRAS